MVESNTLKWSSSRALYFERLTGGYKYINEIKFNYITKKVVHTWTNLFVFRYLLATN